jgi:hypothetical protein
MLLPLRRCHTARLLQRGFEERRSQLGSAAAQTRQWSCWELEGSDRRTHFSVQLS